MLAYYCGAVLHASKGGRPKIQRHTSDCKEVADAGGEGTWGLRLSAQQLDLGVAGLGSKSAIEVSAAQLDGSAPDAPVGIWLAEEPTDIVSEGSEQGGKDDGY